MKKQILLLSIVSTLVLSGCQEKPKPEQHTITQEKSSDIPLIKTTTERVSSVKNKVCYPATPDNEFPTCTHYDLQTISSNVPWINDYFLAQIKKDNVDAFDGKPLVEVTLNADMPSENQSGASVRYIGQNYDLATFEYFSSYYPAGAAHGMYSTTYVTLDLEQKKVLKLDDVLQKDVQAKVKEALISYNRMWLEDHGVGEKDLRVSDNFYFDAGGLVFVYSIYELASYAEGETKLTIPYHALTDLVKADYLSNAPKTSDN